VNTPHIHNSLAAFHCSTEKQVDAGDHTILIGRVKSFDTNSGKPLATAVARMWSTKTQPKSKRLCAVARVSVR